MRIDKGREDAEMIENSKEEGREGSHTLYPKNEEINNKNDFFLSKYYNKNYNNSIEKNNEISRNLIFISFTQR